jgi:hypothetical protein
VLKLETRNAPLRKSLIDSVLRSFANELFLVACLAFAAISLSLNISNSTIILAGPYDSELHVEMARSLAAGEWLGGYDYMSLVRLPLYPAVMAMGSILDIRFPIIQHSLLLIGFLLLVAALRETGTSRKRCIFVFLLLAFNPLTLILPQLVVAETLGIAILSAVFAGCIGVYGNFNGNTSRFFFWLLVLVASFGIYTHNRAEGMWIIGLLIVLVLMMLLRFSIKAFYLRYCLILLLPLLSMNLIGNYISALNNRTYSVYTTTDLAEPNFSSAMNWMTRVSPESHRVQVPITAAAFAEIYKVSPSFLELKDQIDLQLDGGPWLQFGCDWMGVCDELSGGWSVWAIREAAHIAGHHRSALQASQFYAAVANEVQQGCESGLISCTSNFTGNPVAPPLRIEYFPKILMSSFEWLGKFLILDGLSSDLNAAVDIPISQELVARYNEITRDQTGIEANSQSATYSSFLDLFAGFQVLSIGFLALYSISKIYRLIKSTTLSDALEMINKEWILVLAMAGILGRSAVVGYVDAVSFDAQLRYILIIYPLVMIVIGIYLPASMGWLWRGRSKDAINEQV